MKDYFSDIDATPFKAHTDTFIRERKLDLRKQSFEMPYFSWASVKHWHSHNDKRRLSATPFNSRNLLSLYSYTSVLSFHQRLQMIGLIKQNEQNITKNGLKIYIRVYEYSILYQHVRRKHIQPRAHHFYRPSFHFIRKNNSLPLFWVKKSALFSG